jgi:trehalose 6-phosphate synthase/phosphatase
VKGQLILSEFTGCSSSLSGAIRFNPWNIEEVSRMLDEVLQNDFERIKFKHAADFKYVSEHTTKEWAESFLTDFEQNS